MPPPFEAASPAMVSEVLGIRYARARDVGLMDGGETGVLVVVVEDNVKEWERGWLEDAFASIIACSFG